MTPGVKVSPAGESPSVLFRTACLLSPDAPLLLGTAYLWAVGSAMPSHHLLHHSSLCCCPQGQKSFGPPTLFERRSCHQAFLLYLLMLKKVIKVVGRTMAKGFMHSFSSSLQFMPRSMLMPRIHPTVQELLRCNVRTLMWNQSADPAVLSQSDEQFCLHLRGESQDGGLRDSSRWPGEISV